jgi:TetR/AcrR family transcriptional repressor of lmrAB and yxaGH operons
MSITMQPSRPRRTLVRFGMNTEEADQIATTVLSQLEGALLLARTYRSLEPMRRAEQVAKLLVRAPQSK